MAGTAKKEFTFVCESIPYLYVGTANAQFVKGEYKTADEKVAEVLRTYPQIREA